MNSTIWMHEGNRERLMPTVVVIWCVPATVILSNQYLISTEELSANSLSELRTNFQNPIKIMLHARMRTPKDFQLRQRQTDVTSQQNLTFLQSLEMKEKQRKHYVLG